MTDTTDSSKGIRATGVRACICADPENCREPIPGYRCRHRTDLSAAADISQQEIDAASKPCESLAAQAIELTIGLLRDIERRAPGTKGFVDYDAFILNELNPAKAMANKDRTSCYGLMTLLARARANQSATASSCQSPEAGTYTMDDLRLFTERAALAAVDAALQAIDEEPELPGDMPVEMWHAIRDDFSYACEAMRIAVRQTKSGIRERLLAHQPQASSEPQKDKA